MGGATSEDPDWYFAPGSPSVGKISMNVHLPAYGVFISLLIRHARACSSFFFTFGKVTDSKSFKYKEYSVNGAKHF